MSCGYSKEILALYVEDDLPDPSAQRKVESHVSACPTCRQYCAEIRRSQSFLKSCFSSAHQPLSQETLADVRRNVMSRIDSVQRSMSWALRFERFFMLGLRSHRYAAVSLAAVVVVSASLLGQIRYSIPNPGHASVVFAGRNTLVSPSNYREWIFAGRSAGAAHGHDAPAGTYHNLYIHPDAYREYSRSGKFPDGTVIVRETFSLEPHDENDLIALQVSVKDRSRFADGWGFFDFTANSGKLKSEAEEAPLSAGCIACHRDKGATDHVFTHF